MLLDEQEREKFVSDIKKATKGKPDTGLSKEESAKIFMDTLKALQVDEKMVKVFQAIREERQRQNKKWGDQSGDVNGQWRSYLGEEVGEVDKALNDHRLHLMAPNEVLKKKAIEELKKELIHTAAVTVAWLEALE